MICKLCWNEITEYRRKSQVKLFCNKTCYSLWQKENQTFSDEVRKKMSNASNRTSRVTWKTWRWTDEQRAWISMEKSRLWKWWITKNSRSKRLTYKYHKWRKNCLNRDNYTCQKTWYNWKDLDVHHINNFSSNPDIMHDINNWITLSREEHKKFHLIYWFTNNNLEQLIEFMNK